MQPGQDSDILLYAMDGAREGLHEDGEVITDQFLADSILKGLPDEYEYAHNCSYNQRDFRLEDVKRTLRNGYADNVARSSSRGKPTVGRGVVMHAQGDSGGVTCFNCSEYGRYRNECPQNNDETKRSGGKAYGRKSGRGEGRNGKRRGCGGSAAGFRRVKEARWWSSHNITSHSDQECLKQRINGNTDSASFANMYSPRQLESPVNTTVGTTSEVTWDYMGGYSLMAITAAKPAPQERPAEARGMELSGSETLGCLELWGAAANRRP